MACVLCVTDGRRAETKDKYYLYHNAISREFQSRHEIKVARSSLLIM